MNTKKNLFLILLMGIFMGACSSKMAKVEATTPQENKEETKDFKVVLGNEIYLTGTRDNGQKYYHFILLAKNREGYQALKELSELKDKGVLTEEEFQIQKNNLLKK